MGLRPLFGDEMKKIVLRQGIIAAVVITALAGCSDEPVDVSSVNSVSDCLVQGLGNEQQCRAAWDQASSEHLKEGPRFEAKEDCSEEFGQCNRYQVQNDDGSFSDVFIPMMAGMMIGNMMSSSNTRHVYHQPLYKSKDQQAYGGGRWREDSDSYPPNGLPDRRRPAAQKAGRHGWSDWFGIQSDATCADCDACPASD